MTVAAINKTQEVTILLVDDDDVDAYALQRAMKQMKILNPVLRARDGVEALEIMRDSPNLHRPYMVLLDLNMPRMGGLEMLNEIRSDARLKSAIVFVLTTSSADEDKLKAYEKNIAGYVIKKELENGFSRLVEMLDNYWRVVELPVDN